MEEYKEKPESSEDKDYEVECLAQDIRRVKMAEKKHPERYAKAVALLKEEAGVIGSIKDLKKAYKKVTGDDSED